MTNPLTPIFPVPQDAALDTSLGLSKRELFAAMAMQGICSSDINNRFSSREIAQWAVIQAAILIDELNKTQE